MKVARAGAVELISVFDGWGRVNAPHLDWAYRVKNGYGEILRWRSETERRRFIGERKMEAAQVDDCRQPHQSSDVHPPVITRGVAPA